MLYEKVYNISPNFTCDNVAIEFACDFAWCECNR